MYLLFLFFFFFQAEDGIRDLTVTGVQTCALPILAVETNGTRHGPPGLDWVCVSPKAGADLVLRAGDELKLIFPQPGAEPERYERLDFGHFFLQPMDGPARDRNTQLAVRYCLDHPRWRLSLQTQKILGIK